MPIGFGSDTFVTHDCTHLCTVDRYGSQFTAYRLLNFISNATSAFCRRSYVVVEQYLQEQLAARIAK